MTKFYFSRRIKLIARLEADDTTEEEKVLLQELIALYGTLLQSAELLEGLQETIGDIDTDELDKFHNE